jgi:hypothetical protein
MGKFPYTCEKCGGAYQRCAIHSNCQGGQFCWETNVVLLVNGEPKSGEYDGYGRVWVGSELFVPSEFNKFIPNWFLDLNYDWEKTDVKIFCQSCYSK